MNKVIILGNVGQDPELQNHSWGTTCKFTVATSERWKDKNTGEQKERTSWHNIDCVGKTAEFVSKWVKKGQKILIEGSIQYNEYEKDGQKKIFTSIKVRDINPFVSGKNDANGGGNYNQQQQNNNNYNQNNNGGNNFNNNNQQFNNNGGGNFNNNYNNQNNNGSNVDLPF